MPDPRGLRPGALIGEARRAGYDVYLAMCNGLLALPSHALRHLVLARLVKASLGPGVSVGRRVRIECKGGIAIGAGSNVNARVHLDGRGGLRIGAGVNISPEAILLSAEHDVRSTDFSGRSRPTRVDDRAWIATRAVILPGTSIGEGAVVGAGAVVRGEIAPWTIVAGNPARLVGTRPESAQATLPPYRRWLG